MGEGSQSVHAILIGRGSKTHEAKKKRKIKELKQLSIKDQQNSGKMSDSKNNKANQMLKSLHSHENKPNSNQKVISKEQTNLSIKKKKKLVVKNKDNNSLKEENDIEKKPNIADMMFLAMY